MIAMEFSKRYVTSIGIATLSDKNFLQCCFPQSQSELIQISHQSQVFHFFSATSQPQFAFENKIGTFLSDLNRSKPIIIGISADNYHQFQLREKNQQKTALQKVFI